MSDTRVPALEEPDEDNDFVPEPDGDLPEHGEDEGNHERPDYANPDDFPEGVDE
jgi:hypothetical protein